MNKIFYILSLVLMVFSSAYSDYYQNNSNYANYNEDVDTRNDQRKPLISDQELSERIHNRISSGWLSKGYDQLSFQVVNGNVILHGSVKTQDDKDKVEKDVRNIEGVRNLDNQLTVQDLNAKNDKDNKFSQDKSATFADKQLNTKIRDTLSRGWLWDAYKGVILNTSNGVVTLEGVINNAKDQQKLIDGVRKIDGVRDINNNLTVKSSY